MTISSIVDLHDKVSEKLNTIYSNAMSSIEEAEERLGSLQDKINVFSWDPFLEGMENSNLDKYLRDMEDTLGRLQYKANIFSWETYVNNMNEAFANVQPWIEPPTVPEAHVPTGTPSTTGSGTGAYMGDLRPTEEAISQLEKSQDVELGLYDHWVNAGKEMKPVTDGINVATKYLGGTAKTAGSVVNDILVAGKFLSDVLFPERDPLESVIESIALPQSIMDRTDEIYNQAWNEIYLSDDPATAILNAENARNAIVAGYDVTPGMYGSAFAYEDYQNQSKIAEINARHENPLAELEQQLIEASATQADNYYDLFVEAEDMRAAWDAELQSQQEAHDAAVARIVDSMGLQYSEGLHNTVEDHVKKQYALDLIESEILLDGIAGDETYMEAVRAALEALYEANAIDYDEMALYMSQGIAPAGLLETTREDLERSLEDGRREIGELPKGELYLRDILNKEQEIKEYIEGMGLDDLNTALVGMYEILGVTSELETIKNTADLLMGKFKIPMVRKIGKGNNTPRVVEVTSDGGSIVGEVVYDTGSATPSYATGYAAATEYYEGVTDGAAAYSESEPVIGEAMQEALDTAAFYEEVYNWGMGVPENIALGITENIYRIAEPIAYIDSAIVRAMEEFKVYEAAYDTGVRIPQGMAAGIRAQIELVEAAARELSKAALMASRMELLINSPSRAYEELGLSAGEGFALGIARTYEMVEEMARRMVEVQDLEWVRGLDMPTLSDEDLKLLWGLAEREAVNNHTEIKLDMGGITVNKMSSEMDFEAFVRKLGRGLMEQLQCSAKGLHM